jgi:hypothetical protein
MGAFSHMKRTIGIEVSYSASHVDSQWPRYRTILEAGAFGTEEVN